MTERRITLPDAYTERIDRLLRERGVSLAEPARLAEAVLRLSDHYINNPLAETPWHQRWAEIAYACYFFPLNYARVRGVVAEGARLGFYAGLASFTDFGSGLGTVPLALADGIPGVFGEGLAIERAEAPARMHAALAAGAGPRLTWSRAVPKQASESRVGHMNVFSFSLTELQGLPSWARQNEALVLIEPGTHQDGRRLLELRAELLTQGYHVWAPCTHASACPLLTESARDWCHDRFVFDAPEWFLRLSDHLPMRNPTLAASYLLMRRLPPPPGLARLARLTGDLRKEKGASRQMVCRGPAREFLSWQAKHGAPPEWPRGALVELPAELEMKGKELRLRPGQGQPRDT